MNKNVYALSMGAFAFGMAEFIMMSILPDAAKGLSVDISTAGNLIASYALGVCVGGPVQIAITRNLKLKTILEILLVIFVTGSIVTAMTNNYYVTVFGRFLSGLPHGAFFGVAAIVANKVSAEGRGSSAVATVMMGMTVANLVGIPLGNFISNFISWRFLFVFNGLVGCLAMYLIYIWIPNLEALTQTKISEQFRFLKKLNPWLLITVTVLVNTGIFCWYSYVNPFLTNVSGIDAGYMPILMIVSGGSMCIGNYIGGMLSDRYSPTVATLVMQLILILALVSLYLFGTNFVISLVMLAVAAGCFFGLSAPIQQLFIKNSKGGEMMGGALAQLAFNLGNAIGAIVGGVVIAQSQQNFQITTIVGAFFASMALATFLVFRGKNRDIVKLKNA